MSKTSIKGPKVGYTDLIDAALNEEENDQKSYFPLRPSAAGYCSRRLAYALAEHRGLAEYEQEKKDPNVKRLLDLGGSVEYHSIRNLRKLSKLNKDIRIKYTQQSLNFFRLKDGKKIQGSMDFAVQWDDDIGFGDVKSAKDKFSQFFKTSWDEMLEKLDKMETTVRIHEDSNTAFWVEDLEAFIDELRDPFFGDNFHQLNGYCCTPFAQEEGVSHGFIYRYNKNDSRHLEVRFKPSMKLFEKLKEKFELVNEVKTLKDIEKVPRDYALGSARCAFCPYKTVCRPDKDALKEYFKTWPKKKWPLDIGRTKKADEFAALFSAFEDNSVAVADLKSTEQQIAKLMEKEKIQKLKLDNGNIYELKLYKTGGVGGGPRMAVKRSKL